MSSPSELLKVNYLVMKHLHFESVRGDLQEGHGCAFRCQYLLFPLPIPFFSSTKSGFLCAFWLRNPRFRAFRAQNRGFCALNAARGRAIVDCSRDDPAEDEPTWVAAGDTRRRCATERNNRGHTAESTPPHVTTVETPPHITTVGTPS